MGTSWVDALSNGKDVKVKIKVVYDGNSKRPSRYEVEYWIDDDYDYKEFFNN